MEYLTKFSFSICGVFLTLFVYFIFFFCSLCYVISICEGLLLNSLDFPKFLSFFIQVLNNRGGGVIWIRVDLGIFFNSSIQTIMAQKYIYVNVSTRKEVKTYARTKFEAVNGELCFSKQKINGFIHSVSPQELCFFLINIWFINLLLSISF